MLFEPGISITKIIAEKLVKRMTQKLLLGQPAYLENDEYKNIFNKWNEIGPFLFNETMIVSSFPIYIYEIGYSEWIGCYNKY